MCLLENEVRTEPFKPDTKITMYEQRYFINNEIKENPKMHHENSMIPSQTSAGLRGVLEIVCMNTT